MLTALVYLLDLMHTPIREVIALDPRLILQGQVWRLVTWVFLPPPDGLFGQIGFFLYLWFTWWVGDALESLWGTARLNLFYLIGVVGTTLAALLFGVSFGTVILNFTLFLAFATLAPEMEILVFFILPIRIKWLALLSLLGWVFVFLTSGPGTQAALVVCAANYLLFFGPQIYRQMRQKKEVQVRRARFDRAKADVSSALHTCAQCGITEQSHPDADFRVTDDGHEYCVNHLPKRLGT